MFFQLLVSGIALGSIYALLALSIVLIHKATDVVNFAQGEMAMFGTFLAFVLVGPCLRRFSGSLAFPFMILLMSGIIISSLPNSPAVFLPYLIILYFIIKELIRPIFSVAINRAIGSAGRATFLSGYNLTCSLGEVASGIMVGIIASRVGLPAVFVICGGILVIVIVAGMFSSRTLIDRQ